MSFVQSHADPAARIKAVIVVGGVHALFGAALVLGLTFTGVIPAPDDFTAVTFRDKPEPTPTTPPEPTDEVATYTPVTAPVPQIPLDPPSDTSVLPTPDNPPLGPSLPYSPPTQPPLPYADPIPTPTPTFDPVSARPRNRPAEWISTEDYSATDIRRGNEGSASFRLVIGSDGRVDGCEITASTGFDSLDRATCRLIQRRARFEPAKDQSGRTVVGTYTGQVTWQIPE